MKTFLPNSPWWLSSNYFTEFLLWDFLGGKKSAKKKLSKASGTHILSHCVTLKNIQSLTTPMNIYFYSHQLHTKLSLLQQQKKTKTFNSTLSFCNILEKKLCIWTNFFLTLYIKITMENIFRDSKLWEAKFLLELIFVKVSVFFTSLPWCLMMLKKC